MTEKFSFTNESTSTIDPDTKINTPEGELSVEEEKAFSEMKQIATEMQQKVNPKQASEMLKNDPEKAKELKVGLKKFWAIANVFADIVVGGIALGVMIKNMNPDGEMDLNPTNFAALVITVGSIVKLVWDLGGMGKKDKKLQNKHI